MYNFHTNSSKRLVYEAELDVNMKLLVVVSSLDLRQPFSATPAWWQLLKGLYEMGAEVIAAPYQGAPIESLWWRAASNPARLPGDIFKSVRDLSRRLLPTGNRKTGDEANGESLDDRAVRRVANALIAPLWRRQLERISSAKLT